jgi:hypothetical protein
MIFGMIMVGHPTFWRLHGELLRAGCGCSGEAAMMFQLFMLFLLF